MSFQLHFRRYRLPFRFTVRTAHGVWSAREGLLIRLEDETGAAGIGEAAPIPDFGTESVDEAEAACRELGETVEERILDAVPVKFCCLRNALANARADMAQSSAIDSAESGEGERAYRSVAALLPAGKVAMERIPQLADAGFRVFKWKVGVADVADELTLLDEVCAALPAGAKLRLDANGAWDRRKAERWLERCAERPIEFVEQPCFAGPNATEVERRRTEDLLLGLAADYPTRIGLDESLVGESDIDRWLSAGWPGVYVIKPSLLGNVEAAMGRLAKARADVVFSSALETAIGAKHALRVAFRWSGETRALGFGVWPLFGDARFDGPATAPFVRWEDVQRIDMAAVWSALS